MQPKNNAFYLLYHLHTLWLFTCQQVLDTVIPVSIFALSTSVSGIIKGLPHNGPSDTLFCAPIVAFWLWILILQFCIHNQLGRSSIEEDSINKSWRPLPAGRVTSAQTRYLQAVTYAIAIALSIYLKTVKHFGIWTLLTVAYNDLCGSDNGAVFRNGMNAAGFFCLFTGALKITSHAHDGLSKEAHQWVLLIDLVLFSTIQAQEFRDENGDRARGRCTMITTIGKTPTRWTLVCAIMFWSLYIPAWFMAGWLPTFVPLTLGVVIAVINICGIRESRHGLDEAMYKLWSLWMMGCCSMPLLKSCFS